MHKMLEIIAKYHNDDPQAFNGLSKTNRAQALIDHLRNASQDLKNDPWDVAHLFQDMLDEFGGSEIDLLNTLLEVW